MSDSPEAMRVNFIEFLDQRKNRTVDDRSPEEIIKSIGDRLDAMRDDV